MKDKYKSCAYKVLVGVIISDIILIIKTFFLYMWDMTRKITLDETLRQKIPKELGITYVPKLKLVFDTNLPSRISLRTLKELRPISWNR